MSFHDLSDVENRPSKRASTVAFTNTDNYKRQGDFIPSNFRRIKSTDRGYSHNSSRGYRPNNTIRDFQQRRNDLSYAPNSNYYGPKHTPIRDASSAKPNVVVSMSGLTYKIEDGGASGWYWKGIKLSYNGTDDEILRKCLNRPATSNTSQAAGREGQARSRSSEARVLMPDYLM